MIKILLAIFLAAPAMAQESPEEKLEIRNLGTCGLVTRYASSQINDTCLQEALNVYLDEDAGISRRKGYAKYNTTAIPGASSVRGFWPFRSNDGTEYMVALSSQSIFSSNGQGSFVQISGLNGLSATQDMDCAQCLGKLWCVNGSDTMFSWDGSSTDTVSTAPTCQAIDCFRNRVALGNCSGTLSQLRLSGELDGTDYTIPTYAVSTSPVTMSIGGINDGNKLVGIMGVYQDVLVLGKLDSTYGLYGFDRDDFTVREISREVGLVDNRSAREKQGSLYWLSKRGIEKMTGPSITRVSDPVRDLIDTIIVAGGNSRSVTDTTQADFQAGNLTASGAGAPMNAVLSPFNVVPSTWAGGDFSTSTIVLGTMTANMRIVGSELRMVSPYLNFNFGCGDDCSANPGWTLFNVSSAVYDGTYGSLGGYAYTSSYPFPTVATELPATVDVYNGETGVLLTSSTTENVHTLSGPFDLALAGPILIPSSLFTGAKYIWINAYSKDYPQYGVMSTTFPASDIRYRWGSSCRSGGDSKCNLYFSGVEEPYGAANSSATFVGNAFITDFSTPVFGAFSTTGTIKTNYSTITFHTQVSADGITWDALRGASDTFRVQSGGLKRIRYIAQFNQGTSTGSLSISSVGLVAQTTGYFVGQCQNPGSVITSWGLFQCNTDENDENITFYVSTGPTCHSVVVATAPWTSQTNNSVVNIATAPYVAYRALFSIDSATQTPTLNDCTINWNEGTSRPAVQAEVYRDRYYLAYTSGTSGTVANDHIAVLDSRDQWALHDAPNCSSLGIYNRSMYCGDSGSSGQVYIMDSGHDDDGSAFSSKIKTKDFDFGNTFQKKILKRMYYDMAGIPDQSYSITLTPSYTIDASTDTFLLPDIDLNEDYSRFIAPKVPASLDYNTTGRWLSFGLSNTGTQGPWKVFGLRAVFSRLTED